jgi:hypothetical protein
MISPTGFSAYQAKRRGSDLAHRILTFPLWSRAFYDLLVTRPAIHVFLQMSFVGDVDRGLEEYDYLTAHQPGARHAPLYFVSGKLFSPNVREAVYARLLIPTLVICDQDAFVSFEMLPNLLRRYDNWRAARITPTRGLPHFENLPETVGALNDFWSEPATMQAVQRSASD